MPAYFLLLCFCAFLTKGIQSSTHHQKLFRKSLCQNKAVRKKLFPVVFFNGAILSPFWPFLLQEELKNAIKIFLFGPPAGGAENKIWSSQRPSQRKNR
jgi:hypothetical protein